MFVAKSAKTTLVILQQHVVKHGSHDQSTHSPKKGGGRVGGGSPASAPVAPQSQYDEIMEQEVDAAKNDLDNRRLGAEMTSARTQNKAIQNHARGTAEGLEDASNMVGKKKDFYNAKVKANGAKKANINNPDPLDKAYQNGYYDAIISAHAQYGHLDLGN